MHISYIRSSHCSALEIYILKQVEVYSSTIESSIQSPKAIIAASLMPHSYIYTSFEKKIGNRRFTNTE